MASQAGSWFLFCFVFRELFLHLTSPAPQNHSLRDTQILGLGLEPLLEKMGHEAENLSCPL